MGDKKTETDILIVDNKIADLRLLTALLEREGYRVRPAEMAQMAIDSALASPPMLILLDVKTDAKAPRRDYE